ncbi:MAG: chemotaxis protein CheB [Thermodesulfobacteriota bacterium]
MAAKKTPTKPKPKVIKPAEKPSPKQKVQKKKGKDFPVVGIGASAGGLEALEKFFGNVPGNPGMGFVVVSHLDPSHASMMASLLQKHTGMKVVQVEDGMRVEPDHVYVIPPDKDMGILNGRLQLMRPQSDSGLRAPVNYFLRHLAQDKGEHAFAVILSGMGSDGTLGVKAVKAGLGMVMVQDPATAKYDGMPNTAIATGLADYILPPEKMPEHLMDYVGRFVSKGVPRAVAAEEIPSTALQKVFMLLRSVMGHDFSAYKESTIVRRVQRRMKVHAIADIMAYVLFLQQNPQEVRSLFKELLIGVTSFFRDPEAFEALRKKALVPLLRAKPPRKSLRVWVPGCSTGEEAYSVAMLLRECLDELKIGPDVQIFATDIDSDAIEKARIGMYPGDIASDVGRERLERFFEKSHDFYRINRKIRDMLIFAAQSLVKDPPFTKLDLICCRNLLIYLDTDLQKKVLPLFHYSLNPEGILFLGSSETIGAFMELFSPIDNRWKIYRSKAGRGPFPKFAEQPIGPSTASDREARKAKTAADLPRLVERHLMEHHTPPAVVIDRKGDISYIHGRTGRYLEPAPGAVRKNNILEMARPDLRLHLPALVRAAYSQKKEIVRDHVAVKQNGDLVNVRVRMKPLPEPDAQGLAMVLFEEEAPASEAAEKMGKTRPAAKADKRIHELEKEIKYTKESLRTTIEDLETANEELKSANEEYQSTNEELQSANEEMNSSKEELQSLNEELETVNAEMQDKNADLMKSYQDMKNLLDTIEIPTLYLDGKLHIRRFTAQIDRVINLRDSDVGRPVTDLVNKLADQDIFKHAKQVLDSLVPMEMETRTEDGRWYTVRIKPFRTTDNMIEGLVLTFLDSPRGKCTGKEKDHARPKNLK